MRAVTTASPLPIVVLTRDSSTTSIDAAVKAGATAYVVDCADTRRIGSLLRVAQTRFKEQQLLRKELDETKNALDERKHIEKAKGIIMQQKNLSEEQATCLDFVKDKR
jgi:response regulator NasT